MFGGRANRVRNRLGLSPAVVATLVSGQVIAAILFAGGFIGAHKNWFPEGLLLGGLLLAATLAGYLALGARRAAQLAEANHKLQSEISQRRQAEESLRTDCQRAGQELSCHQARLKLQFERM